MNIVDNKIQLASQFANVYGIEKQNKALSAHIHTNGHNDDKAMIKITNIINMTKSPKL